MQFLLLLVVVCCPWLVQHEILLIGKKYTNVFGIFFHVQ